MAARYFHRGYPECFAARSRRVLVHLLTLNVEVAAVLSRRVTASAQDLRVPALEPRAGQIVRPGRFRRSHTS
ncbi:hypothetical protein PC116_g9342 [Phytophthora cactorum]|uniref:Uncharacterized protein n=1 Tax=Phytophthora cactorum TaxID=29920 RepID=A0A8T1E305_9STRA|nr:hypothetical protein Pcac1_g5232 [Phytophthora cactorum]KAG2918808.1 hypothetical protein PC114_g6691 [Phytophthora cactorum]KAG2947804.1 hypothetical protein PC117_g6501 [Phytophthora cactorum]KAG3029994.1 hypothetical protein PC119_g6409 [Phytophthora cactorum]KAG3180795.1 hypothetical protein C6341_g6727 [Phytophthora cactorum]